MINIVHAQEKYIRLILDFIREFAGHIGSSDQVLATEESLGRTLFGSPRYAEVLLANFDNESAGFALFSPTTRRSWANREFTSRTSSSSLPTEITASAER